jgi:alpha-tubulin suppressor-like RCC1 family protein
MKASEEHKAGRIKGNNNIAFRYDPFTENDVLAITNTYKSVFILLKNGNIFTFNGENSDKNKLNSRVARPLKTPTKIIDLACGHDHCLARGSNYAVYSWGSNDSGQLGLSNFNASFSRKEEPTEISILSTSYRINRVYARNNTSYAVSESNNLIGWGSVNYT